MDINDGKAVQWNIHLSRGRDGELSLEKGGESYGLLTARTSIPPSSNENFQILHQGSQTDSSTRDRSEGECLGVYKDTQFILTFVIVLLSSSLTNTDSLPFSAKHWEHFYLDSDVHSYFPDYS